MQSLPQTFIFFRNYLKMTQLSIFKEDAKTYNIWKLYIDGASRGNPGHSGAGIYLLCNNKTVIKSGFYLGNKTNNQAEYLALLIGLAELKHKIIPNDYLEIISDSQLLIRQLSGHYAVKNEKLKTLYLNAKELLIGINCKFKHVLREENTVADELANIGIEKKHAITEKIKILIPAFNNL